MKVNKKVVWGIISFIAGLFFVYALGLYVMGSDAINANDRCLHAFLMVCGGVAGTVISQAVHEP